MSSTHNRIPGLPGNGGPVRPGVKSSWRNELHRPSVIRKVLSHYGLRPNKALGQNFLADANIVRRIVEAAHIAPGDAVIEIGPGIGGLTWGLLQTGAQVYTVEKDAALAAVMHDLFPEAATTVGDALKIDLAALLPADTTDCRVVANLPYYVTSPLLMHVLESTLPWKRIVVMMQREVAQRLTAQPATKAYGALTVAVQFFADVQSVTAVPPTVFVPAPKVWSEVVLLTRKAQTVDAGDPELFFQLLRLAFGQRRKTLRNALSRWPKPASGRPDIDVDAVQAALKAAGVDSGRRGETVSLEEFAEISLHLHRSML